MIWRKLRSASLAGALAALYASACGGGSSPEETWCSGYCKYYDRCRGSVRYDCVPYCTTANANYLEQFTSDYQTQMGGCLSNASCTGSDDDVFKQCHQTIAPQLQASAAVLDFCKTMGPTFFGCYWGDADLATCAKDFVGMSDAAAARVVDRCSQAACDDLTTCITTALKGTP